MRLMAVSGQNRPSRQPHAMPGSGMPTRDDGHSELGVRPGRLRENRHPRPGPAAGDQLADDCGVPVLREASHSLAIAKIISNRGPALGAPGRTTTRASLWLAPAE
jgi:hypothetical protein